MSSIIVVSCIIRYILISIVVFSQSAGGKELINIKELTAEKEFQAAQQVAEELGGTFRQVGHDLVIDGIEADVIRITSVCRAKKLTWMENKSFTSGQRLL